MDGQEANYYPQILGEANLRMSDLEEKQKILKNRLLLIGENLIEIKEDMNRQMSSMKKEIEMIKRDVGKLVSFLEMSSNELSKFAKKEDVEILARQAKMFQPMEFVRKKDLEKLKKAL